MQRATRNVNVTGDIKQEITVKDEAALQKQNFFESQAFGDAIRATMTKKRKSKYEEALLMYEVDPSVERVFELAEYAKKLFGAGLVNDVFGPILKEYKILVVKHKGKYKK